MVFIKRWLQAISLGILLFTVSTWVSAFPGNARSISAQALAFSSLSQTAPPLVSYLPPGNAITDGKALLRYALPIDSPEIRKVQKDLEDFSEWLRSKRWGPIKSNIVKIERILNRSSDKLLATVSPADQAQAKTLIGQLQAGLMPLREAVEAKDKEQVWLQRSALLDTVGALEALMVKSFPYEVPAEYSGLPQLKGRATVEFTTNKGSMTAVVDGYSAPVTAGNFVDLVQRGFYDGLEFVRAEDNYVLQTGDPKGPDDGFIDPKTNEYRAIPLEILVQEEEQPIYGSTLESLGLYLENPVLPFSAFGTLGMARPGNNVNGGSSQFFFFLFEPELTPAGLNLLDGRYTVFGYVVENKELLESLTQGDKIISARVVDGAKNLVASAA
ncbi:MAG: peptidylprolyl isomerase [Leptolyngbyaceae cyanobacterium SM1_1_3]|nr:peptidylprolyl isomerase [Leptolyngbyaceae cyanobacterium SM1_1_3]NJN03498.1 peptidylprolyl isomerase [Leptolyngbyaceae cyanobacterium RM1_1_2]NJO09478.1 peptidylprolyl isomerase [Leptolyngbyaceae cyanobacterium SL_1_1]